MRPKILILVIALCFVTPFGRSNYAKENSSDSPKIQHVLFLVSDDLKASALGCYGNTLCKTPNIDRLAREGMVFENAYCQGLWCAPSRTSFMHSRYRGEGTTNLGQCFREAGWHSARVGKIYHMRVPGDIIAGTDGNDVPSSWDERFNSAGLEAHTPGHYACLNLNVFTDALENRQSTRMPHRMFVTVRYDGDGTDQPDSKSATKAIELLKAHRDKNMFLAVGFVRPHYPNVAPQDFFDHYPWERMPLPKTVKNDLSDIPKAGLAKIAMTTIQLGSTRTINAECGRATTQLLSSWIDRSGEFLTNWNKLAFETRRQSSSAAIMAIISASMGFGRNTITMKTSPVFPLSFQPRAFHLGGLVHLLN